MRLEYRIQSDRAAVLSVEMIVTTTLSVFVMLSLYEYVLIPVSSSSQSLGFGLNSWLTKVMESGGAVIPDFGSGLF